MSLKLTLCLVLSCLALPAAAREMELMTIDGIQECAPGGGEAESPAADARAPDKRAGAPAPGQDKSAERRGAEVDATARPPRWHSFLPGMFR